MIEYINSLDGIREEQLDSEFFDGWPNPPSRANFYRILQNSTYIWLAVDSDSNKVVGFINAISDKVLTAYIPLLEVVPAYQKQGIGSALVDRMLEQLKDYYMVDLLCDADLQGYYENRGMRVTTGMMKRNYNQQSGKTL